MNRSTPLLLTLAAAIALTSCKSTHILPPTIPNPEPVSPIPQKKIQNKPSTTWNFTFNTQPHTYQSTTNTILQTQPTVDVSQLQTIPDSTIISTTTQFTLAIDRTQPLVTVISGSLNRIQSISGSRVHLHNQQPTLPLAFSGILSSSRLSLSPVSPIPENEFCQNPINSYFSDIRPIVISLPHFLRAGSTWTDTISTATCSGIDLPTRTTTVHTYTMIEEPHTNPLSLFIKMQEHSQLTGLGSQGEHQIQVDGQGFGSAELLINPTTGLLSTFHLIQHLTVQINTSGKITKILQLVEQNVKILN